jgi:predicted amidohydrolase
LTGRREPRFLLPWATGLPAAVANNARSQDMVEQYMALALQPAMRGATTRSEIRYNLDHISDLIDAACWLSAIDLPVKLIAIPEGAIQGFTDEVFDWDHERYVDELAIDIPGPETEFLGRKAIQHGAYVIAQAKARHPEFPRNFFNCAFIIDPSGEVIHRSHKLQVFTREHSTVPHDVWDRWIELYGDSLDAFFPVTDTAIGRIGTLVCMEGSYPETARGLAMNGAEIIYRPSYPEPYVSNGLWEVQNRARALDNTCFLVAPNVASYRLLPEKEIPIDTFGGASMIVDYQGRVITNHAHGGIASYAGAIIDIEALRQYRSRSLWGNWLKDLRTEQYRCIYRESLFEPNMYLDKAHKVGHAEMDEINREAIERMFERGIWKRPSVSEVAAV